MTAYTVKIRKGASTTYDGNGYAPNPISVKIGDTITWVNEDDAFHTITSGKQGAPDGVFDSSPDLNPVLAVNKTFSHKFDKVGECPYFCKLHPNEVGIIHVLQPRRLPTRQQTKLIHGHFFFVDIVGLSDTSKHGTESQIKKIKVLQESISKCAAYRSARKSKRYINLTGDGMVIGFLEGPHLPLQLAIELHKKLNRYNKKVKADDTVKVRIGIDSAPILQYKDILGKTNVWGDGIVLAKRIMDKGHADDIFLSDTAAQGLVQLEKYRKAIHFLGEHQVKHGRRIKIHFAYGNNFGNSKPVIVREGLMHTKIGDREEDLGPESALQIVNFGVEPSLSTAEYAQYRPNLRNDASYPVSNIRIYYKIMDRIVDLADILRNEDEIRKQSITYEGSILPGGPGKVDAIMIPRKENEMSCVFWITYEFGMEQSGEIAFDIRFKNFKHTRTIPYTHSAIQRRREEIAKTEQLVLKTSARETEDQNLDPELMHVTAVLFYPRNIPRPDRVPSKFLPRRAIMNWNTKTAYYMNKLSDDMLLNRTITWTTREWIDEQDYEGFFQKQGFVLVRRIATPDDLLRKSHQTEQEFKAEILHKKIFELDDTIFFRIRFKGWLRQGFFDCQIIPPEGDESYWSYHPKTLQNGHPDTPGDLRGLVDEELTWGWPISTFYPTGKYTIYLRVYDHIDRKNRPVIAQSRETVTIVPRRALDTNGSS